MSNKEDGSERLREKGRGVSAYFGELAKQIRRNVADGVQSATRDSESRFGRPPSVARQRAGRGARTPRSR